VQGWLAVGIGGFAGSVLRYKLGGWVIHHTLSGRFPASTFAVNVAGCLLVGALAALSDTRGGTIAGLSPRLQLLLITGFCGGFTTFSAFGFETFALLRREMAGMAALYVTASVVCGMLGVWLGWMLVSTVRGN
jgi:CrcB protein